MAKKIVSPNGSAIWLAGEAGFKLGKDYTGENSTVYANSCQIPGGTIRTSSFCLHAGSIALSEADATIDASGKDGSLKAVTSNDLQQNATDASSIFISCAHLTTRHQLLLRATGGNGGEGYSPPTQQLAGGIGGRAGDGADVAILVGKDYDDLVQGGKDLLRESSEHPQNDEAASRMTDWAHLVGQTTSGSHWGWSDWLANLTVSSGPPADKQESDKDKPRLTPEQFLARLAEIIAELQQMSDNYFRGAVQCHSGLPGVGGLTQASNIRAEYGHKGKDGSFTSANWTVESVLNTTVLVFHPEQVRLTVMNIEQDYFVGTAEYLDSARAKLDNLIDWLSPLAAIKPSDPLYQAYVKDEYQSLGVFPSINTSSTESTALTALSASLAVAKQYRVQLDRKLDFYGHSSTWVPRVSYESYQKALAESLIGFNRVEDDFNQFTKNLGTEVMQEQQNTIAAKAAAARADLASAELASLVDQLRTTASQISRVQAGIPAKLAGVESGLQAISKKIQNKTEWPSMKDFLGAMGQLAFCPEPEMVVIQGASLYSNSLNSVHDDSGEAVDKKYLVEQITVLGQGLEGLKEGITISANDPNLDISDPGAALLLAQENDIMKLIDQYRSLLGDDLADFRTIFDDYVASMTQRNNAVLLYNNLISFYLKAEAEKAAALLDCHVLETDLSRAANSGNPAQTNIVTHNYLKQVAEVMWLLYQTQRALFFRSLVPSTDVLSNLAMTAPTDSGMSAAMSVANVQILHDGQTGLESLGSNPQFWGDSSTANKTRPVIVSLSDQQVEMLRMQLDPDYGYSVDVTVPLARRDSHIDVNPFASKADVRISKVRFYLEGINTSAGTVIVNLIHNGEERFSTIHDKMVYVTHDPIYLTFEYDLGDPMTVVSDISWGSDQDPFGMPGPFARWTVSILPEYNTGLDMSMITKAWFEFSGYSRSFA